jgi:phospholipid-transporting ATPase
MLICMALCHTIICDVDSYGKTIYNASSPDELALVNWAKFCGVEYIGMDENNNMMVNIFGVTHKYELLHVLEFNSFRFG